MCPQCGEEGRLLAVNDTHWLVFCERDGTYFSLTDEGLWSVGGLGEKEEI